MFGGVWDGAGDWRRRLRPDRLTPLTEVGAECQAMVDATVGELR